MDSNIIYYAFRYALGRSTYAVSDVCNAIRGHIDDMRHLDLHKIVDIIEGCDNYGMEIDKQQWLELKEFINNHLGKEDANMVERM